MRRYKQVQNPWGQVLRKQKVDAFKWLTTHNSQRTLCSKHLFGAFAHSCWAKIQPGLLPLGLVKNWHLKFFLHPTMTLVSAAQKTQGL